MRRRRAVFFLLLPTFLLFYPTFLLSPTSRTFLLLPTFLLSPTSRSESGTRIPSNNLVINMVPRSSDQTPSIPRKSAKIGEEMVFFLVFPLVFMTIQCGEGLARLLDSVERGGWSPRSAGVAACSGPLWGGAQAGHPGEGRCGEGGLAQDTLARGLVPYDP